MFSSQYIVCVLTFVAAFATNALHCCQGDVQSLLKTLQQSTRCLHHFSGHSKVSRECCYEVDLVTRSSAAVILLNDVTYGKNE